MHKTHHTHTATDVPYLTVLRKDRWVTVCQECATPQEWSPTASENTQ